MISNKLRKKWRAWHEVLYILPFIALVLVFSYYPLYGWAYAFFDYKPPLPLTWDKFVGLKWFQSLVSNRARMNQMVTVLRNTFAMSGLSILTSWMPMLFAVLLNEVRNERYKKTVQIVTTLPNFISWVLVYSIAYSLLNTNGMVNSLLMSLGVVEDPILFLQSDRHVWLSMWLWSTWKSIGWSAIMYIAAIAGIDQEMYEAAKVDGASRVQCIVHITIPSLLPTYFVLLLLSIASFLSNGMEQYYVFQNAFNKEYIQVLDLYVYNIAMGSGSYSVSTALSMLKSLISLVLLCFANGMSKLVRKEPVF